MKPKACIPILMPNAEAGFSLIELLVVLFLSGMMLTLMTGFFQANVAIRYRMGLQTEAQQGLRALMEMISQELRQAGACLPQQGQFIALDTIDSGNQDSLTLRIGRTAQESLVCIRTATTMAAVDGATTLTVADGEADTFDGVDLVYITPNGATGEFYTVTDASGNAITIGEGLVGDHPEGSGIYAVDERTYAVDPSGSGGPVLTVSIDGGTPYPLVAGVEEFDLQYLLAPCDALGCAAVVDEPADDTEWRQVREVAIAATVRSHKENKDGDFTRESGYVHVKPRNLL